MQRARVAERLHIEPSRVDAMPYQDVCDLLELWRADAVIEAKRAQLARRVLKR